MDEWYPTVSYIKDFFEILKLQYNDLETELLMDEKQLEQKIEILKYGLPLGSFELNIFQRAGLFLCELIKAHLFTDGNKRIAIEVTHIFLKKNGFVLDMVEDEEISFLVEITQLDTCDYEILGKKIEKNCKPKTE